MKKIQVLECLAAYTGEVFRLPIRVLDTQEKVETFAEDHFFHPLQTWLCPGALQLILDRTDRSCLLRFSDALNLQVALFFCEGRPVLVGPFLTEPATERACARLVHRYPDRDISAEELQIYYGRYPVVSREQMDRILHALPGQLGLGELEQRSIVYAGQEPSDPADPEASQRVLQQALEEHYREESLFMDAVAQGNAAAALEHLGRMSCDARALWLSAPLRTRQAGAAVSRTMARAAAYRAGVPAPLLHRITQESARRIAAADTEEKVLREKEDLVRRLCRAVSLAKEKNSSALVQTVRYALESGIGEDIREEALAKEIGVSESHMIAAFRQEMGRTPGQYLRELRMKKAARMLSSSRESIQAVAEKCGIPDSSYFVRLFRARYGCTPRDYRKRYCI